MIYPEKQIFAKDGRQVTLRSARKEDAETLIAYMKAMTLESRNLVNEPEEISLTMEQEERFISAHENNPRALLLVGFLEGEHVGNASIHMISSKQRFLHRCGLGIALYQKFWNLGIGRQMMEVLLETAKAAGYEQVELEVVADNVCAVRLYESLGFTICGTLPHGMKYKDGSYADMHTMIRNL